MSGQTERKGKDGEKFQKDESPGSCTGGCVGADLRDAADDRYGSCGDEISACERVYDLRSIPGGLRTERK